MKNMPMWARFTCSAAAGAGEAAREAPSTKTCPCRRIFMLGFKGGAEDGWGGGGIVSPPPEHIKHTP